MKHAEIDFTKYKIGDKVGIRKIALCPRCKRNGVETIYPDGDKMYAHKGHFSLGWVFTEHCYIRKDK